MDFQVNLRKTAGQSMLIRVIYSPCDKMHSFFKALTCINANAYMPPMAYRHQNSLFPEGPFTPYVRQKRVRKAVSDSLF